MANPAPHRTLRGGTALAAVAVIAAAIGSAGGDASTAAATAAGRVPHATRSSAPLVVPGPPIPRAAVRQECRLQLPPRLPSRTRVVPTLMYHLVGVARPSAPAITRALTVDPADFDRQMSWLRRHGYRTVTQRQLFAALMCGRRLPRKPIMLTFDDGYRNVLTNAVPVLTRLHMRATAYVISARLSGSDRSFLTWRQLHTLERAGVEIGSHTVSHASLPSLSDDDALAELAGARRALERRLGHRVPWLAYPYGAYDARIVELARRAGYLLGVTTQPGAQQRAHQPLALSRLRILDSTGVRGLAAMLAAAA